MSQRLDNTILNQTRTQEDVAAELLEITKSKLMLRFRFLSVAIHHLKSEADPEIMFATDGSVLRYSPDAVVGFYKKERTFLNRLYLHTLFHCMLQHMYADERKKGPDWDLACDIAVEHMIVSLRLPELFSYRDGGIRAAIEQMERELPAMTAELIHDYLQHGPMQAAQKEALSNMFRVDDHAGWMKRVAQEADGEKPQEKQGPGTDEEQESWDAIARRALMELENFSNQSDLQSEPMIQNLKALTRRKYDYRTFLQRFFTRREEMRLNMDEFDQVFYTYGHQLYQKDHSLSDGKMVCLIEPLEVQEEKRIGDFAIIIDTSYSVKDEVVQNFLQKTYDILNQSQYFFRRFCLHLIQADDKVQEDIKITSLEEMESCMQSLEIKGLGNTDFRPALQYVQGLVEQGEFRDLKGVLYFTDGDGIYPKKKTQFDTAFVFVDDYMTEPVVPPWAFHTVFPADGTGKNR